MRPRGLFIAAVLAAIGGGLISAGAMAAGGSSSSTKLPVKAMERALHAKGSVTDGNLNFGIDRNDINNVHIHGVPIKPAFEVNGEFDFQSIGHGRAFMNGDIALKPSEINRFIDAVLRNGLTFQAEHQHMYDFNPMVWFIHIRGTGDPVKLAKRAHNALKATATPLPQAPPKHPKTPLNVKRLKNMLHGFDAEVGDDGVVTVYVARRDTIHIHGIRVKPATNIATNIGFEPLNKKGTKVAVMPDFGMTANEINSVVTTMRKMGWDIGCLYNQETDEHPQLYFSHEFKVGKPYKLAAEVRKGLDHTNIK